MFYIQIYDSELFKEAFEKSRINCTSVQYIENGLIGFFIIISAFLYPIKQFRLPIEIQNKVILCSLFLLGAFFVHRSAALYIFLGIALNVLFWHSFIYNKKSC